METERIDNLIRHSRILIVEDNRINQMLVKNVLKNFGFSNYETAENSDVALKKLSHGRFDIILMDIQVPGMNGFEITVEIRTKMTGDLCNIPIIALTGNGSEKEKKKAREAGMNDYVVKPYLPEELYSVILKHLNKKELPSRDSGEIKVTSGKKVKTQPDNSGVELDCLQKYTGGDINMTVQLIELFLKEVPSSIEKLEKLIPSSEWKEVHAVSHKMKSCISIFELEELKRTILAIEESSREISNTEDIPELFTRFKAGCNIIVNCLEEELRKIKESRSN